MPERITGAIVCESLKPGTVLEDYGLHIRRWSRYDVDDVPSYQSPVWTLIEFDAPAEVADALAQRVASALLEPGWYANWSTEDEMTVVYADRVFRYRRGDRGGLEAAKDHGRRLGVPEPQLDWERDW